MCHETWISYSLTHTCTAYLPHEVSFDKHIIAGLNDEAQIGQKPTAHHIHILHYVLSTKTRGELYFGSLAVQTHSGNIFIMLPPCIPSLLIQ